MTPKILIRLVYYTNPNGLYQTIVYGQIEGKKHTHSGQSDFHFSIEKNGRIRADVYKHYGGAIVDALGIKTKLLKEARKRISVVKKKLVAGKSIKDWEEFTL